MNKLELQITANEVRKGIVTAVHSAKAGHPGGSLSAADIFTYLYFEEMNIDPKNPKSRIETVCAFKGTHGSGTLLYTCAERLFPVEDLKTLRHLGSYLQGHPDMKHIPGVDMSSGSLGQGISAAVGMALSAKLTMMITEYIHFSAMARFRRDRSGRLLCLRASEGLITLLL